MTMHHQRRYLCLALAAATTPVLFGLAAEPVKEAPPGDLTGVVTPPPRWTYHGNEPPRLALVTADGVNHPLVNDAASRAFFKDPALLNRPMIVTGRLAADHKTVRVISFHSIVKGEVCEVYYWCEVCSIRRSEKNICECCGGPMELREVPVKK
jgi:hypothetical protein